MLGVALAGTVVAEAVPGVHAVKLAVTVTLPVPVAGTGTWKGTFCVTPGLPFGLGPVVAVSVPGTTTGPVAFTTNTVIVKVHTNVFFRSGQPPLLTTILATPNAGDGTGVGVVATDDAAGVGAVTAGGVPDVVALGLGVGVFEGDGEGDGVGPGGVTTAVCAGAAGPRRSVRSASHGRQRKQRKSSSRGDLVVTSPLVGEA